MKLNLLDLSLVGSLAVKRPVLDSFESYASGPAGVLNGGNGFAGPWTIHVAVIGTHDYDPFEDYADGADPNGLAAGAGFGGPNVSRVNYGGVKESEDFEAYADGVGVNGLAGGFGWSGSFVAHHGL